MSSAFERGPHFFSQVIEREHVDQTAPGELAPLALNAVRLAAPLKNRQRFVVPQQLRDREGIGLGVNAGIAHDRQRDARADRIDAHDAPPARHPCAEQFALSRDEPSAVEDLRVATTLTGPSIQCVGRALDFISGEFAVDEGDVDANATFAESELVQDEGIVAVVFDGQSRAERDADVVIVHRWRL
jgi:hypothetical protein